MTVRKKIVVAMSGGVDSSLTAALLKEEGHEVWGVSLRVFEPGSCQEEQSGTCCSARDLRDARRVAAGLDIPFSSWDVREEFERDVIAPFIRDYREGRTPNPCVHCNGRIKFDLLLRKVRELGADALATGHYARLTEEGGVTALRKGRDDGKDQSYFLFAIGADSLPLLHFPLGGMKKDEVRRRARAMGLEVAGKKESQEICFVPGGDYGAFLRERLGEERSEPGPIVDTAGRRLGTHRGLIHYTVGQRRGLAVAGDRPLYVLRLDREHNALVIGGEEDLEARGCDVSGLLWLEPPGEGPLRVQAKIRSRHTAAPASVLPLGGGSCRVEFDVPQRAVTPGQAAVFYSGDRVLGGGWIDGSF